MLVLYTMRMGTQKAHSYTLGKKTLGSRNVGDEKTTHWGDQIFPEIFSSKSLFQKYSLFFSSFFVPLFCFYFLLLFFFEIKNIYSDTIHIQLCRWVSDKKITTRPVSRKNTTFLALNLKQK